MEAFKFLLVTLIMLKYFRFSACRQMNRATKSQLLRLFFFFLNLETHFKFDKVIYQTELVFLSNKDNEKDLLYAVCKHIVQSWQSCGQNCF